MLQIQTEMSVGFIKVVEMHSCTFTVFENIAGLVPS